MNTLVLIPARGGSKGIPGKNIKQLNGIPLIHYTINEALKSFTEEQIYISSDDDDILNCSLKVGKINPIKRPHHLSTDTSSSREVMLHALDYASKQGKQIDTIILLQPTSPFRTSNHIDEAVKLFSEDVDMVVSVKNSDENPYYSLFEENSLGYLSKSKRGNFTTRQDCPSVYAFNGAIYILKVQSLINSEISEFKKIKKYLMTSLDSLDLDTPLDWKLAELMMQERKIK